MVTARSAEGTVSAPAAPRRETRRIVTVLFLDVVGSTELAEDLDPEAYRALMARYFEEASAVVAAHGGYLEKFIGDAVMAVFGIPRLHEDDALRAVSAAVQIRDRLRDLDGEFHRAWGATIGIRGGIETGEAMSGARRDGELYVTGATVSTAARLEQVADPGDILVGAAAFGLVRDAVVAEAVGPLPLKGKSQAVPAWRVAGVIPGAEGWTRRLDAPIVGRRRELDRLLSAFERTASGCQVVTVLGPAGVGKSRLLRELVERLGDRAQVLQGRCLPYGDGITFWPVVEMLRQAAHIADQADAQEVTARLQSLLGADDDGELIAGRLAGLLGATDTQPPIQELFWAVRKALELVATSRPLVVVLDDLHWAEPTLLDLLDYLADWMLASPVLLVCLARGEILESRPGWVTARPNAEVVTLQPLAGDETRELVQQLAGEAVAEDVVARIAAVSEGNPLFVEEILRMLVDTGELKTEDGTWRLAHPAATLRIPSTIHALVSARLDRLDEDEGKVLEAAAVVGKVFSWSNVAALVDDDGGLSIAAQLQSLLRKQLIRPRYGDIAGEDSFEFAHALIRDTAYQQIPKTERVRLHERFATWLERDWRGQSGEFEEIAGYHLEQAYRTLLDLGPASPDAALLAQRAFVPLSRAGDRASARGDMPAAVNLLSRATGLCLPGHPDRVRILPQLAFALMEAGDFPALQDVVAEVQRTGRDGEQGLRAHGVLLQQWLRLFTDPVGWADEAQREASQALRTFQSLGDERGLARASSLLGVVRLAQGRFADAEQHWTQASLHARNAGDQRDELESLSWVPLTIWAGPTPAAEGIRRCQEILRRSDGDKKAMSSALMAQGAFEAGLGRFTEARESLRQARDLLAEVVLPVWSGGPYAQLAGWVEILAGDADAAERVLRTGVDTLQQIGEMSWLPTVAGLLGEALWAAGRSEEADAIAAVARDGAAPDDVYSQALWRTVAAKVLVRAGRAAEAEALAREAVDLLSDSDFLHLQWHAHLNLATVLEAQGRLEDAAAAADRAAALAARKGSPVCEQRARDLSRRLLAGG